MRSPGHIIVKRHKKERKVRKSKKREKTRKKELLQHQFEMMRLHQFEMMRLHQFEMVDDIGIKNILVTAGYINKNL